jgi:hypothetical protein
LTESVDVLSVSVVSLMIRSVSRLPLPP